MKKIMMAGLALALAAPILAAQSETEGKNWTPPSPQQMAQRHVEHMTNALGLNSEQQQKITTILTQQATAGQAIRQQEKLAHEALATAIKTNNQGTIQQQAVVIGNLTAQRVQSEALTHAATVSTSISTSNGLRTVPITSSGLNSRCS